MPGGRFQIPPAPRPDMGLMMGRQGSSLGARALGWPRASTSGPGPHTAPCSSWGSAPGPSHRAPTRTCDVRVREQLPLHLQSADFEPSIFDDVHRGAALDPVHAVLVGCRVPWETKGGLCQGRATTCPCFCHPPIPHPRLRWWHRAQESRSASAQPPGVGASLPTQQPAPGDARRGAGITFFLLGEREE